MPSKKTKEHSEEEDGDNKDDKGSFDLRIRPLSTRKADIPQCEAAEIGIVPKHPFRFLLSGASGSGKSTLLLNLLRRFYIDDFNNSYFDNIYAIGPTVKFDDLYKNLDIPDKNLISKPDVSFLQGLYNEKEDTIKAKGIDKATKDLVIFEDIISHKKFMNSTEFLRAYVMGRHYSISIMVCTQSYTKLPRACRIQCCNVAFFPSQMSEMELIRDEYCPPACHKKTFAEVVKYATSVTEDVSHPFLFIDMNNKDRFKRCLHEIIQLKEDHNNTRPNKKRKVPDEE